MKKLEEYINETEQIDEGVIDLIKGLFSSKGLKAASNSIQQSIENSLSKKYPNFMKAFNELQKSDAEDKELIDNFNKIYEAIDGMKLNDNQKVFQKLCQLSIQLGRFKDEQKDKKDDTNQDKNVTPLDKETHKAYFEDLTKKMQELHKQHEEICKKYDEAVNKGEVKEEDVLGKKSEGDDMETPTELAAHKYGKIIAQVINQTGISTQEFQAIDAKLKTFIKANAQTGESKSSNEGRISLEDFVINEGSARISAEDVRKKLDELLNSEDEKTQDVAAMAFTYLLIGYVGLGKLFDGKLTPEAVRAIIVSYNDASVDSGKSDNKEGGEDNKQ